MAIEIDMYQYCLSGQFAGELDQKRQKLQKTTPPDCFLAEPIGVVDDDGQLSLFLLKSGCGETPLIVPPLNWRYIE